MSNLTRKEELYLEQRWSKEKKEREKAEELIKMKIDLYNKLIHIPRKDVSPAEVNIMFEISRDPTFLDWIDKKLYGEVE
jgi:hypothetical protein